MTASVYTPETKGVPDPALPSMFLGGSIEMGKAIDWQAEAIRYFLDDRIAIFNPRRRNWDSTWTQSIENEVFVHQVEWELFNIQRADVVIMVLQPNTMSPISLLELGIIAGANGQGALNKMIVSCPDGFWRKGNVDIVARKYSIPVVNDTAELFAEARAMMLRNHERRTTIKNQGWDYGYGVRPPG